MNSHRSQSGKSYLFVAALLLPSLFMLFCSKKGNNSGGGTTPPADPTSEVTISVNDTYQVIEGFGCATVFVPSTTSLSSDECDRLFGKSAGQIGLNILRIRIATDNGWRAIELANAKQAVQRGAKVIATPWSPPPQWKTNNNLIGGSFIPDSGAAYAKYLNDFADYMSGNGAPVYAVSVQNEPDIQVTYESCNWTANEMKDFIKNYGALVTSTRLMATESFNNNQTFTNTVLADAAAAANLDIVGGHIYGSGVSENTVAKSMGKEVWMTEHLDTNITYTANLATATEIHNCLTKANFSAYVWWYGKRFYGPIGETGLVTKRGYLMSQFAKYIIPGSVRIGASANTLPDVLISAYKAPNGKKVIVAINNDNFTVKQTITVTGASIATVMPYTTTANTNAEQGSVVTATNNAFTYSLPALSVTTFVEQ